jgi:hypothetical protein
VPSQAAPNSDDSTTVASDANVNRSSITHSTESIMASTVSNAQREPPIVCKDVSSTSVAPCRQESRNPTVETVVEQAKVPEKPSDSSVLKVPTTSDSDAGRLLSTAVTSSNASSTNSAAQSVPITSVAEPLSTVEAKSVSSECEQRQSPSRNSFLELLHASPEKSTVRRNDAVGHSISSKIEGSNSTSWEANSTRANSFCSLAFTSGVDSLSTTTTSQSSWLHNLSWINPTISPCPEILPELSWNLNYKDSGSFDSGLAESIKTDASDGQRVPTCRDYGSFGQKNVSDAGSSRGRYQQNSETSGSKSRERDKMKTYNGAKSEAKGGSSAAFFSVSQLVEKNPLQTNASGHGQKGKASGQYEYSREEKLKSSSSKQDYRDQSSGVQKTCVSQPSSYSTESLLKTQQPPQLSSSSNNVVSNAGASYSSHGSLPANKQKTSRSTPTASVSASSHVGHGQVMNQAHQPDFRRSHVSSSVGFQGVDQPGPVSTSIFFFLCFLFFFFVFCFFFFLFQIAQFL